MKTEKLNLVKILRGCEGVELWSDIYGEVTLNSISNEDYCYPIFFITDKCTKYSVTSDGMHLVDYVGNCTLWPSRNCRDWSKFKKPSK